MCDENPLQTGCCVLSGNALLGELLKTFLEEQARCRSPLTVILDAPWGYAYSVFEALSERSATLVVTDNPCGEYWDDLWDLAPTVLIAKQLSSGELLPIIDQLVKGERLRLTPFYQTPLTKTERKILRLCATQGDLKEVAEAAQVGAGTLKNHLSSIYGKLGLRGLVDLGFYYLGGGVQTGTGSKKA